MKHSLPERCTRLPHRGCAQPHELCPWRSGLNSSQRGWLLGSGLGLGSKLALRGLAGCLGPVVSALWDSTLPLGLGGAVAGWIHGNQNDPGPGEASISTRRPGGQGPSASICGLGATGEGLLALLGEASVQLPRTPLRLARWLAPWGLLEAQRLLRG